MVVDLPEEIEVRLDALAKATGRTKAAYAEEAIISFLEDLEDLRIAEERLAALDSGEATPISLEEMMKRHGLAD